MKAIQLDLFVDVDRIPWYGVRPRDLTRGAKLLFLRREPGDMSSQPDPLQCEMFFRHQARRYSGAPLIKEV